MITKSKTKNTKRGIKKVLRSQVNKESIVNFRTKASVKKEATKIFDKMGLDMSSALNTFLYNVIIRKAMPMNLITENGYTVAYERELLAASKDEKGMKTYTNMEDFWKDLNSEKD